jgi:hypothetical protein
VGLLGVDAGAGVDAGQAGGGGAVGEVERLVHGVGAFADADGEDGLDAGGLGAAEDFVAVCWSLVVEVEMCVRVDQVHRALYQGYRESAVEVRGPRVG